MPSRSHTLYCLVFALAVGCGGGGPGAPGAPTTSPPPAASPSPVPASEQAANKAIVACFYDEAREAGMAVLREGGSAADAFVAITLVDYVRAPGVTGLGGPLAAMTFDASSGRVESLDATFDAVHEAGGLYDPNAPAVGASVLVPGALRGLEALWKTKGKLSWSRLVEPAARLATDGYRADRNLVTIIGQRRAVLERSAYARALFLPSGEPLAVGALVRQPELAALLGDVAKDGARAMYEDDWAAGFVAEVNARGGKAALGDLSGYRARWDTPWSTAIGGRTVYANAGRAYGGIYGLVGLAALSNDTRADKDLEEVDRLEVRLRMARALHEDPWFYTAKNLDNPAVVARHLADAPRLWAKVQARAAAKPNPTKGSHSLHVTVIDAAGNAVTGTNTINSLPWGSGIFVRGVALTDAGATTYLVPGPGERVVNGLTLHVMTSGQNLVFLGGAFGSSLLETELQILTDAALGADLTAADIAARPRFGSFPFDWNNPGAGTDQSANYLDTSAPASLVTELGRRGLIVKQDPYGDTGWGSFAIRGPRGDFTAATLDMPYLRGAVEELTPAP